MFEHWWIRSLLWEPVCSAAESLWESEERSAACTALLRWVSPSTGRLFLCRNKHRNSHWTVGRKIGEILNQSHWRLKNEDAALRVSISGQKCIIVLWILCSGLWVRPGENLQFRVNMQRKWVHQVLEYVIISTWSILASQTAIKSNY